MKPYDRHPDNGMRDRWMVSYMDVLTILLVFFVAVAAKNVLQINHVQANVPVASLSRHAEEHAGLNAIRRQLMDQGLDARIDLRVESRGLVIRFPQAILFGPGEDQVARAALPLIANVAAVLKPFPNKISIVGHADRVSIHNRRFHDNWELAAARGLQLLHLLATRFDISESRLSTVSYGSFAPKSSNDTAEGRASNRRVEILVLDEGP